jgi:phosphatidylinositol phospholipase C beta
MFAQNREDRKRVEKALDISGLPSGKVRNICFTVVIFNL